MANPQGSNCGMGMVCPNTSAVRRLSLSAEGSTRCCVDSCDPQLMFLFCDLCVLPSQPIRRTL